MESKDIKDIQLYARAFDAGYKIRLYNEELYLKIENVFKGKSDEYSIAFLEGCKEGEQELAKKKEQQRVDKNKEELSNIRNKGKEKDKDISR